MEKTSKSIQKINRQENDKAEKSFIRRKNLLILKINKLIEIIKDKINDFTNCCIMCDGINNYVKKNNFIECINYYEILPRKLKAKEINSIYNIITGNKQLFKTKDIKYIKSRILLCEKTLENYENFKKQVDSL